jgi:hypothetical protein
MNLSFETSDLACLSLGLIYLVEGGSGCSCPMKMGALMRGYALLFLMVFFCG